MAANPEPREEMLTARVRAEIDHWVKKFPPQHKRAAVIAGLTAAQDDHGGWLTPELIEAVAEYLEIPPVAAHEVATFYSMFDCQPVGRHKIYVCTNISCMLCGSDQVVQHLNERLGIRFGETTPDGRFTLKEAECLAACGGAPACMIGRNYHENLTPEKIDRILDELK